MPLDPVERRDEWHRAVLMVALVVTGMTAHGTGGASTSATQAPAQRLSTPTSGRPRRRHIRPPRSC